MVLRADTELFKSRMRLASHGLVTTGIGPSQLWVPLPGRASHPKSVQFFLLLETFLFTQALARSASE